MDLASSMEEVELRFRSETHVDTATGLIFAELYYPDDATTPIATSPTIYPTHEAAKADVLKLMQQVLNQAVKPVAAND
jgi:hypothetical protein